MMKSIHLVVLSEIYYFLTFVNRTSKHNFFFSRPLFRVMFKYFNFRFNHVYYFPNLMNYL